MGSIPSQAASKDGVWPVAVADAITPVASLVEAVADHWIELPDRKRRDLVSRALTQTDRAIVLAMTSVQPRRVHVVASLSHLRTTLQLVLGTDLALEETERRALVGQATLHVRYLITRASPIGRFLNRALETPPAATPQ